MCPVVWHGVNKQRITMFPKRISSPCVTLSVRAPMRSSPPYTFNDLLNFETSFSLPPAWSQWWCVVSTDFNCTAWSDTAVNTRSGSTGSTTAASFVSLSIIYEQKVWILKYNKLKSLKQKIKDKKQISPNTCSYLVVPVESPH